MLGLPSIRMDSFALLGVPEYPSRKVMTGEPSKEKEPCYQYSPPKQPRLSDFKKRKRGRPPLEKDSRSCTNCGTSETPEWRKGPLGPHTLCNACGLQWMKAQKRDNEVKHKYEEAKKKNSLMRMLNPHANAMKVADSLGEGASMRPTSTASAYAENSEINSRYSSPEMDIPSSDASPSSTTSSPMQAVSTPISIDTLNTIKAMQTLSALSQMNQLNHYNTLNHLNILCNNNNNTGDIMHPSYATANTVINHFNTSVNAYNSNTYLTEMATPVSRFSPMVYSPMTYGSPPNTTSQQATFNPYLQQYPIKEYASMSNTYNAHASPQLNISSSPLTHHHPQFHSNNPLLQPNPQNLIPNPTAINHNTNHHINHNVSNDDISIGGGQM